MAMLFTRLSSPQYLGPPCPMEETRAELLKEENNEYIICLLSLSLYSTSSTVRAKKGPRPTVAGTALQILAEPFLG